MLRDMSVQVPTASSDLEVAKSIGYLELISKSLPTNFPTMAREANVAQIVRYIERLRVAEAMEVDLLVQIMALPPNRRIECMPILARLRTTVEAMRLAMARAIVARYGSE